jgi:hypothetical protein
MSPKRWPDTMPKPKANIEGISYVSYVLKP